MLYSWGPSPAEGFAGSLAGEGGICLWNGDVPTLSGPCCAAGSGLGQRASTLVRNGSFLGGLGEFKQQLLSVGIVDGDSRALAGPSAYLRLLVCSNL